MDALLRASGSRPPTGSRPQTGHNTPLGSRPPTGQGSRPGTSSRPPSRVSFADLEAAEEPPRGSRASTADSRPSTRGSDDGKRRKHRSRDGAVRRRRRRSRDSSDEATVESEESILSEQGIHVRKAGFGGRKNKRRSRKSKEVKQEQEEDQDGLGLFGAAAVARVATRPRTTGERRRKEPEEEESTDFGARPVKLKKRPTTPVFDDNFERARAILRKRFQDRPHLRPPGSQPKAKGIGLDMSKIGHMSVSYLNQYVEASINVLREHQKNEQLRMQASVEALQGSNEIPLDRTGQQMDVFERAELPEIRRLPLCSQLARGRAADPVPKGSTSPSKSKSSGAAAMLRDRLLTLARLARDDLCLVGVRFTHENIDDDWGASTAQALRRNTQLQHLVLVGNGITDASGTKIAHAVAKHPGLVTVAVGGNSLGDKTALAMAKALKESGTLLSLNLASKKYHQEHYLNVCRRRNPPKEIIIPKIEGDYFSPENWGLPTDDPEFNPRSNFVSKEGCFALSEALHGTSLTALNLSGQRVGDAGALALSRVLFADKETKCSCSLSSLALDANRIGDKGAAALIECWANPLSSLETLRLAMNSLGDEATVKACSLALKHYKVDQMLVPKRKKKRKKKRIGSLSPRARRRRDIKEGIIHVKEEEPEEDDFKDLGLLDLSLCQIGEIGVLAVHGASARCKKIGKIIPVHGNPGHDIHPTPSRRPSQDSIRSDSTEYKRQLEAGRSLKPVQFGGSRRADSGAPLLTLKKSIPFLAPDKRGDLTPRSALDASKGTESVLRTVARKASDRQARIDEGALPESRKMKRHKLGETGKPRYAFDPDLPPLNFLAHHKSHIRRLGAESRRKKREEHDRQITQEKRENLAANVKSKRLRKAILDAGITQFKEETAEGALRTRVIGDMMRTFPAVAALPGAQSGRMDLSRDGPRFGHRKPDPESPKKWAAKLAAKKAARHRAFLVHLGQHPIH